jgi:hypothetical protein
MFSSPRSEQPVSATSAAKRHAAFVVFVVIRTLP